LAKVTTIQRGIAGPYCVAGFEDNFSRGVHFVGDDNKVYRLDGLSPVPVSPPDLDGLIESVTDKTTIEMSAYISRGHGFIEVSLPGMDMGSQHVNRLVARKGALSRLSVEGCGAVYAFSKWLTGDYSSGNMVRSPSHLISTLISRL
jgi:hypothetical protein